MSHSIDKLMRDVSDLSHKVQSRDDGMRQLVATADQTKAIDNKLYTLENLLATIHKDLGSKDYTTHFNDIKSGLNARHDALLEHLPERMGHIISSRAPNLAFYVIMVIIFQILVMAGYVFFKRRMRGSHQKYL